MRMDDVILSNMTPCPAEPRRDDDSVHDAIDADFTSDETHESSTGSALAIPEAQRDVRVPAAGEYWRVIKGWPKNERKSLRRRTVLLIAECRYIDDSLHSVVVKAHPLDPDGYSMDFTLVEFLSHFRFEPQANLVRTNEMAAIQRQVEHEQLMLSRGPSAEELGIDEQTREILALPPPAAPSSFTELAKPEVRERMELATRTQIKVAQAQAAWLSKRHDTIQGLAQDLASFYSEQSSAAMARVNEMQKHADALEQGVKSLGLYLGQGVSVHHIRKGDSAAVNVPLTLFQAMRYLDEEYAVYRALDGATWRDFDDFTKALNADRTLLERVLPTERCVVAMRYRHHSKRFDAEPYGADIYALLGAFREYLEEKERNESGFLLIRDGENIYQVQSDVVVEEVTRLFPTQEEKEAPFKERSYFRGVDESTITPDSTRYYHARTQYDATMLFYRRLMLLMAGLNDRLGIFGQFYDSAAYPSFMSLKLQMERFNYIYDEETLAIGEGRPTFSAWWTACNAHLTVGSRVMARYESIFDRKASRLNRWANPTQAFGVAIAERGKTKGSITIKVPVQKWRREYNATVSLTDARASKAYLVLDAVSIEDLDFYINSRAARPDYLSFLALFIEARKVLKAEQRSEAAFRRRAFDQLADSCPGIEPETLRVALQTAIMSWRSRKRGEALPKRADVQFESTIQAIVAAAKEHIQSNVVLRRDAESIALADGREPLRVVRRADGTVHLYVTPLENEKPFGDAFPHTWVASTPLTNKTNGTPREWTPAAMREASNDEVAITEWPQARQHYAGSGWYASAEFLQQLWDVRRATDHALTALDRAFGEKFNAAATISEHEQYWKRHITPAHAERSGELWNGELDGIVPIGIGFFRDDMRTEKKSQPYMVCISEDLFGTILAQERGEELIGRLAARIGMKTMPTSNYESVPQLDAYSMRYRWQKPSRDHDFDIDALKAKGYTALYPFGHRHVIARVKFEPGEERRWGDAIIDQIDDLMTTKKPGQDRIFYLAPGVRAWLRGRTRPAVGTLGSKRAAKRPYMRRLNVTDKSTTRSKSAAKNTRKKQTGKGG